MVQVQLKLVSGIMVDKSDSGPIVVVNSSSVWLSLFFLKTKPGSSVLGSEVSSPFLSSIGMDTGVPPLAFSVNTRTGPLKLSGTGPLGLGSISNHKVQHQHC